MVTQIRTGSPRGLRANCHRMLRVASRLAGGLPTRSEARATHPLPVAQRPTARLLWGTISREQSEAAGARFPTSSISEHSVACGHTQVPESVRTAVLAEVPEEVLPKAGDTPKDLVQRLRASDFVENSHVLKGGKGPARVLLKGTAYPQPRRRSWSVEVDDDDAEPAEGVAPATRRLLNYTAHGRLPSDWEARPMPRAVFELGVILWSVAYPSLTEISQVSPPTACQLLLYYRLFGSCMPRHRDNYKAEQMREVAEGSKAVEDLVEGSHHGGDANSQVIGSNVLVYTDGDADMTFALSFPASLDDGIKDYVVHPIFCVPVGSGTLLVFSPIDDIFFCHEAWFEDGAGTHRLAFVFRWLAQVREFDCATDKMVLPRGLQEKQQELVQKKRARAEHQRRAAMRRG